MMSQQRRRRCGVRRRHSGQINLSEPRHGRHRTLLRGAAKPTDRLDEALQHALAALIQLSQPKLRLH